MKLLPLAMRSIRHNLAKYAMYFFTFSFSVFTVYSFLALLENEFVNSAFHSKAIYRAMLTVFGVIIFVFVMFFLISSNASFIRARKKEISLYSLFGMNNKKIGQLIFLETLLVGSAALILGVLAGIFFSKLIAMILLKIALVDFVGEIKFSFSPHVVLLTVLPFLFVFGLMGLSGFRVIRKFQLVDLFKSQKVSETKPRGSVLVLILSLTLIGTGYYLAATTESHNLITMALPILFSVIIGTYLFFGSGLPKMISWLKVYRARYYRADNLIAISAIAHRLRTIGSTMATIAILSAVATTAVATGFNLYKNVEKQTYESLGYDLYFYGGQEKLLEQVYDAFAEHNVKLIAEHTAPRWQIRPKLQIAPLGGGWHYYDSEREDYFRVYSQSECNTLLSLSNLELKPVKINPGEAVYLSRSYINNPEVEEGIKKSIKAEKLEFTNKTIQITDFLDAGFLAFGAIHVIVLNDDDFSQLYQAGDILTKDSSGNPFDLVTVFKYANPLRNSKFAQEINGILERNVGSYRLAHNHYVESLERFGLGCFIGFFISIVFILMTASLLYFQQIMAAGEEQHQYRMLSKIGLDIEMKKRVVTKRLLPIFLIPLIVGIIHSIFAMKTADSILFTYMIMTNNSFMVVLGLSSIMYGIYAVVYGLFYIITRRQYLKIINCN